MFDMFWWKLVYRIICLWCKQNGTADASTMYADEIYTAGFCYGLDVAVGESYNGVGEYLNTKDLIKIIVGESYF